MTLVKRKAEKQGKAVLNVFNQRQTQWTFPLCF